MDELRRNAEYRGTFNEVPKEGQQKISDSYKDVLVFHLDEVQAGIESYQEKAIYFEKQAKQNWEFFRGNRAADRNFFGSDRPEGWTQAQCKAALSLDYLYSYHASTKLKNYFGGLANLPPKTHPLHPKLLPRFLGPDFIDKVYSPPVDYAGKHRFASGLGGAMQTEVVKLWEEAKTMGEIGFEWQPTEEFENAWKELYDLEEPVDYLKAISSEDSQPLIEYLYGQAQSEVSRKSKEISAWEKRVDSRSDNYRWLALQMDVELDDDDEIGAPKEPEKARKIMNAISSLLARARVSSLVWDKIGALIEKHMPIYPLAELGPISEGEHAHFAGYCDHWSNVLKQYLYDPDLVREKVKLYLEPYERNWRIQADRAYEAALKDNEGLNPKHDAAGIITSGREAQLLKRDASHAQFIYFIYCDYLQDFIADHLGSKPSVELGIEQLRLMEYLARPPLEKRMPMYREIGKVVPKADGTPASTSTIQNLIRDYETGKKVEPIALINHIVSTLQSNGRKVDVEKLKVIKGHSEKVR